MSHRLTRDALHLNALLDETAHVDGGALVVFGGVVRRQDQGAEIQALDYDAHQEMAQARIRQIEEEILEREGVLACRIVHRWGLVPAGEASVLVVVRGRHRPEAFEAARDAIDEVKARVPLWKEDVHPDGVRAPHPPEAGTPLTPEKD